MKGLDELESRGKCLAATSGESKAELLSSSVSSSENVYF